MNKKGIYVGYLAITITGIATLSNIYNITVHKNTHSIQYFYIIISFIAQIFWLVYAIIIKSIPIILLSIYMIMALIIMLVTKIYLESTGKDKYSKLIRKCNKNINTL